MIDLKQYLKGIAIGIKFRSNYSIKSDVKSLSDRFEMFMNYFISNSGSKENE
jgi:hypothetical protein